MAGLVLQGAPPADLARPGARCAGSSPASPATPVSTTYILNWELRTEELLDNTRAYAIVGSDFDGLEIVMHCPSEGAAQALLLLINDNGKRAGHTEIRKVTVEKVRTTSLDAFL